MLVVEITKSKSSCFNLKFDYDQQLIDIIRNLDGANRKWIGHNKTWDVYCISLMEIIRMYKGNSSIFFDFGSEKDKNKFVDLVKKQLLKIETEKIYREIFATKAVRAIEYKKEVETEYDNFDFSPFIKPGVTLFKHQKKGILWLNEVGSGILGAQMGLGKTLMFTLLCDINPTVKKALIICPNSLKYSIAQDIENFLHSKYHILKSKDNKYKINEAKFFITNYEYFNSSRFDSNEKLKKLGLEKPDIIIFDESHRIKEESSNTYRNIFKSFSGKEIRFIMSTGTPIKSYAHELFTQLKLINPYEFKNKASFYKDFCGMTYDFFLGKYIYDEKKIKLEELNEKIEPYLYRIKKTDVLDLPEKIFKNILIEITDDERRKYNEIARNVVTELGEEKNQNPAIAITIILKLRQFCSNLKTKYIRELIDEQLAEGEKIIVIDFFKESLKTLNIIYSEISGLHTGDENIETRNVVKKRFMDKEDPLTLFLGSSGTCKEGLTLTVSNIMYLNTIEWTVADNEQIFDRIHRISQDRPCYYYTPIIKDSIDEDVFSLVEKKKKIFSRVIDNEKYESNVNESVLSDVIANLKNKFN